MLAEIIAAESSSEFILNNIIRQAVVNFLGKEEMGHLCVPVKGILSLKQELWDLPLFLDTGAQTHTIQFNPDTNTDAINNKSAKQEDIILSRVGFKSLICKAAHKENWVK